MNDGVTRPPSGTAARLPAALGIAAVLIFLVYTLNFLYFFVDDEGIAFVFAQNLLDGRGLAYNSFEGRVEGYSDFLHIIIASGVLAVLRAFGVDKIYLFFIGKAFSLAMGAATVLLLFATIRRLDTARAHGAVAGLSFIALAGPLAIWSCSSLEMAFVAFLVTVQAGLLLVGPAATDRAVLVAAILLVLLRIDGFIHAGAVIGGFWLFAEPPRRRQMLRTIILPLGAAALAYHGWRVWYFREWLTGPLYSKILYKLMSGPGWVMYNPPTSYGYRFLTTYGLAVAVPGLVLLAIASWKTRAARPLMFAAIALGVYAARVGDWMAGYRFFVPVLPILSLMIALTVSSIRRAALGRAMAAILVLWFSWTAYGYAVRYHREEFGGSWWLSRSFALDRYLGADYELVVQARSFLRPGTRTSYNQAGLVPFLLDLDNMDDLGLCSLFVAKMPTTDVIFTEPGRYSPLTDLPTLRTANAYVLYREPAYVLAPMRPLKNANGWRVPETILDGRYRLRLVDRPEENVVYERTNTTVVPFQTNPNTFLENLAHTSRVRHAMWNAAVVEAEHYTERLPFLMTEWSDVVADPRLQVAVQFAPEDLPIYELHVNRLVASNRAAIVLTLGGAAGGRRHREELQMEAGESREVRIYFPEPVRASRLTLDVAALGDGPASVHIFDLRVQGQTPALAAYVRQLPFPAR